MMSTPARFSYGTASCTSSCVTLALTSSGSETNASAFLSSCRLDKLRFGFDTVAGGAASFSWYLSEDSDGKRPLTAITAGVTPPTGKPGAGWWQHAADLAENRYSRSALYGVLGTIYLQVKLDAGTANLGAYLSWTNA